MTKVRLGFVYFVSLMLIGSVCSLGHARGAVNCMAITPECGYTCSSSGGIEQHIDPSCNKDPIRDPPLRSSDRLHTSSLYLIGGISVIVITSGVAYVSYKRDLQKKATKDVSSEDLQ